MGYVFPYNFPYSFDAYMATRHKNKYKSNNWETKVHCQIIKSKEYNSNNYVYTLVIYNYNEYKDLNYIKSLHIYDINIGRKIGWGTKKGNRIDFIGEGNVSVSLSIIDGKKYNELLDVKRNFNYGGSKKKTKSPKIHIGPRGGKYIKKKNKKIYIK